MIVAYIPARGGSKSIPLKNIKEINGKPLIYWSIKAALGCPEISRVYVGTDSLEIFRAVRWCFGDEGGVGFVSRPEKTCTDTASTESALLSFIEPLGRVDDVVLMQCTTPTVTAEDLSGGIRMYQDYDSVVSVCRQKKLLWNENGTPINYDPLNRPRRQEQKGFLVENGAFFISSRERILESGCRFSGKVGLYEMPEYTYYELDEPHDWLIVEQLIRLRNGNV